MIDEHEWKSVLQIFQDGTISQASKHLFISQPSLSQCIKKIETELGMQIFDRSTTPLQLTESGRIYVNAAKKISEIHKSIIRQVNDLSELRMGQIRIGSSRTRSVCLLSDAIVAFHKRYPNIRLSVVEGSTERLYEHVLKGNVDFALLYEPLPENLFQRVPIMNENILFAVPPGHHLTQNWTSQPVPYLQISFAKFHCEPFVALKPNRRMSKVYEELCSQTQAEPQIVFEANSILSAAELCAKGMGATIITEMVVKNGFKNNKPFLFAPKEIIKPRHLVAAYGKQSVLSRAAEVFLEFLH